MCAYPPHFLCPGDHVWARLRRGTPVSEVYIKHKKRWKTSPDDDVIQALERMITEDTGRLVILEGDHIAGLITRNGIARYVQIKG